MRIARAFGIKDKEVVALVGGGGKTTAMFRLAEELTAEGKRVVTTTTTRIFAAQIKQAPFHIFAESEAQALRDLRAALREHSHVLVIGATTQEGKAFGVAPSLVDKMVALDQVDVVLDEADGSRMRPFKAPGEHEPVIPDSTTLLVPVVGIDAVGAPLDDEHVHRAERAAALAGVKTGASVDPELVARVLTHREGGLKNRPPRARVVALINKAQNVAQLLLGRDLAGQILQHKAVEAVALGAVQNAARPIAELHRRVAAVVLAAGGSTRMEGPLKQLLPWGDSTLVRRTVEAAQRSQVAEIIVVVGKQAEEVRQELEKNTEMGGERLRVVVNPDWARGRSTSVRAGLEALRPDSAAAVFVNADQPFLTVQVIDTILLRHAQTLAPIVVPLYAGKRGSPVLFERGLFGELKQLQGESGGRAIVQAWGREVEEVNILNARAGVDVDTPADYAAALAEADAAPSDGILSTIPSDA